MDEKPGGKVETLHKAPSVIGAKVSGYSVVVDGRAVPHLRCHEEGDNITFILDNRFSYSFPVEWSYLAAAFAAQAMAIGAGYASFAAETRDRPFAARVVLLGEVPA